MSSFVVTKKNFELNSTNGAKFLVSKQSRDCNALTANCLMTTIKRTFEMPLQYTLNPTNGQALSSFQSTFPSGKYDALTAEPVWSGHRFVGWFPVNETPSQASPSTTGIMASESHTSCEVLTAFAHWQLPVQIQFDATTNGGQIPSGWSAPYYYNGQQYGMLPAPTHSTLNFKGWFTQSADGQKVTSASIVNGQTTLYAQYTAATYELVDLDNEWELNSSMNPDPALYDGCYQSFSNYGIDYSTATLTIKVIGYSQFTLYIRSYSAQYDYVQCECNTGQAQSGSISPDEQYYLEMKAHYESLGYQVYSDDYGDGYCYWYVYDQDWNWIDSGQYETNYSDRTSGQNGDTTITGYKQVTYVFDSPTENYIYVRFYKNSGWTENDDRGYVIIPYDQN